MTMKTKTYQHNPIGQLKGFFYTAHLGSVSKAAQFLGLSQPSISLQIKALERSLGTPLFSRKNHRMDLTPHGKTLFKEVGPLLQQIETLYSQFKVTDDNSPRPLKISCNHAAMNYMLPSMIKSFWANHKNCHIQVDTASRTEGIISLENGTDAFLTPLNFDIPSEFSFVELDQFEVQLITHKNHPITQNQNITLKDISSFNLTPPPEDLMSNGLEGLFTKQNTKLTSKKSLTDWEITKKFIRANLAITIGASIIIEDTDTDLFTYSLSKYFEPVKYGIIVGHNVHPLIHDFIESYTPIKTKQTTRVR